MEQLLEKAIEAHGGLKRWNEFNKIEVAMISAGKLLGIQGIEAELTPR